MTDKESIRWLQNRDMFGSDSCVQEMEIEDEVSVQAKMSEV